MRDNSDGARLWIVNAEAGGSSCSLLPVCSGTSYVVGSASASGESAFLLGSAVASKLSCSKGPSNRTP
ncbi:hypothetical protein BAUCODRAFT_34200 [Baudoinia panamericana UAMH 10762]|uniref:Uncharacterized protein n=1 Tax=Baudoinia panamericana (strain UAMH 10762) TaxID=717646 RepID=M2LQV0_BAUPA|nr:uncharacterized protein BAUCODRAFT_34200 [Baudoinia panamericana UAMH 10762]EMC96807.1 hypothetical protein BAUCODRAFT_34200 [Baudoinia panamericana UAMH 10762]